MNNEEKVMISQDDLETMRWDASRAERSTVGIVVTTGIIVGVAAVAGMAVYTDVKVRKEHGDKIAKMEAKNEDLTRELAELKARMEKL